MATFSDQDKKKLEELRKALAKTGDGVTSNEPWQEPFSRETSVPANKSTLASDIIRGFSGSWAASYNYGMGAVTSPFAPATYDDERYDADTAPVPVRAKTTKLGLRGVPDIDFVPYNWRTNRSGSKGPSLVGHPISYEVVGPTLKSPFCDHTWTVTPGTGANGGDVFRLSPRAGGGGAVVGNITDGYGPDAPVFTIGGATEPNGGLYILVADDGTNPGSIPAVSTPLAPLAEHLNTARYELFRVASISATEIEVHPSKPISDYFDLPAATTRVCRAVTLIKPYVTRLQAIRGSGAGVGQEQVFATVSPEFSATSDLYPPFDGGTLGDGSWQQGGFESLNPTGLTGEAGAYGGRNALPLPFPIETRGGPTESVFTDAALPFPPDGIGYWRIQSTLASPADIGLIAKVYNLDNAGDTPLTFGEPKDVFGYFPIVGHNAAPTNAITLQNVATVDPTTGAITFGPGPYYRDASGSGPRHNLVYSLHNLVSDVWLGDYNPDVIEGARIKNLIDPRDVERFEKQTSNVGGAGLSQPAGASHGRPERAIFDTSTDPGVGIPGASNPGSLLDLGFRMVLFPAQDDGVGNPIPDFDNPIDTRGELTVDPTLIEKQYVEVDYSSGLVRLSHAPNAAGGDVIPNGIIGGAGTSNPREEVVLFAACVPYSMEESQLGTGVRLTGGTVEDVDAFSSPVVARVDGVQTTSVGAAPFVGPSLLAPNPVEIVLDRRWENAPRTGVIEILERDTGVSQGLWGYTETRDVSVTAGQVVTALGGISSLPAVSDPSFAGSTDLVVKLRRDVTFQTVTPNKDFGYDSSLYDTTYGSSQRVKTLRVDRGKLKPELDGTFTLDADSTFQWHQSGLLTPSSVTVVPASDGLSSSGILEGVLYQDTALPAGNNPSTGFKSSDPVHGPFTLWTGAGAGAFSGFATMRSQIYLTQSFRYVVKFAMRIDLAGNLAFFSGLTSPAELFAPGIVTDSTQDPPNINRDFLGIRVFGDPIAGPLGFEWVAQNRAASTLIQPTNTTVRYSGVNESIPYTMVIETEKYWNDVASAYQARARMCLYDQEMHKMSEIYIDNPDFLSPEAMEVVQSCQNNSALPGTVEHRFFYASIVTRTDLPTPKI